MTVFEKIKAQQKGKEGTAVWMVGEQLKDICRKSDHIADIVSTDLDNPDMAIEKCERKIEEYARKNKKGSCGCCPPNVAEDIIKKFYGIPDEEATNNAPDIIYISDFL